MKTEDATLDQIERAARATLEEHVLSGCSAESGARDYCGTHANAKFLVEEHLPGLIAGRDARTVLLGSCDPAQAAAVRCNVDDEHLARVLAADEEPENHAIKAQASSDDGVIAVDFDALRWFAQASDAEITALRSISYRGNVESDAVAEFFECGPTAKLFRYLSFGPTMDLGEAVGFECSIDPIDAERWIAAARPAIALPKAELDALLGVLA